MNFPLITNLADLVPFIEGNPQIRVKTEPCGKTVVCYMLQDEDTFAGQNYEYERECRGITFHEDGTIASRTLHKFFNIGEREDTQPHSIMWPQVRRIMDKRDGSMVTPVLFDNVSADDPFRAPWFMFKTKKSFTTKEAALAVQVSKDTPNGDTWIIGLLQLGFTPTFEITSPKYPIVLKYDKDELTLLHVRENTTGRYLTEAELKALNSPFPIVENVIEQFYGDGLPAKLVSWPKLKAAAETRDKIEGWIIQLESGEMFKVKTQWYCDLHHSVTFTRWRDIARTVCEDKADDLKGAFALTGRSIEPILKVEREIKAKLQIVQNAVELHVGNGKALDRTPKDMALALREHELFGLIMTLFRGKEPDYMGWYVKNHLEADYDLEVVEVNE